jgi:hypothetical protein
LLSQISWFDEFLFERPEPEFQRILDRGRNFSIADQQWVMQRQRRLIAQVIPAYKSAAERGLIDISATPYYHPIMPLLCDTDVAVASSPGLPLPKERFRYPQDAEEQLLRGLGLHERLFGAKPLGVWPSEGSVSEEVLGIGAKLGVTWMATDEGVLGRSLGTYFDRDEHGILSPDAAAKLYRLFRFDTANGPMHLLFRDHLLSDLIGFVYSGMPARDAADHFVSRVKQNAKPVLERGVDAVIPVILDGENAWEFFPRSGREFLRTLYASLQADPEIECCTVSKLIATTEGAPLEKLTPGSWINSNFNVWIGSPEDNKAWDYLTAARRTYDARAQEVDEQQRALALEELLIAEGSDWNWWYGPEHSTANDHDFDELYRKHLSNIYAALGVNPPAELAQPILRLEHRARFVPQSAYIRPRFDEGTGFFDWIGAAHYRRDHRDSAMHGKQFLFDGMHAGIDEEYLYLRIDFLPDALDDNGRVTQDFDLRFTISLTGADGRAKRDDEIALPLRGGHVMDAHSGFSVRTALGKSLLVSFALDDIDARIGDVLHIRTVVWKDKLPLDAIPAEGAIQVPVLSQEMLEAQAVGEQWSA